jgi:site-specific DNA-methyltransferase (adenine-specific)
VRSHTTDEPTPGAPLGDVWEIGIVAPVARERTGYPTQKPQALLERLVLALTNPGDLVLDPYAGSGTTLVVAALNGRQALGIDESDEAWQVAEERLAAIGRVTCHGVERGVARAS